MSIRHQVESGAPSNADGDLRMDMDIVIKKGGVQDVTAPEYRNKVILLDVTYADLYRQSVTCVQAALSRTGWLLPNMRSASAVTLRSAGTSVLRRTQL